jgi:hypothetical protein
MVGDKLPRTAEEINNYLMMYGFDGVLRDFIGAIVVFTAKDRPLTFASTITGVTFFGPDVDEYTFPHASKSLRFYALITPFNAVIPRENEGTVGSYYWEFTLERFTFEREGKLIVATFPVYSSSNRKLELKGTVEFIKR